MKELLINTAGFQGTIDGWKKATSRLGDRRAEYASGEVVLYKENALPFREMQITITGSALVKLKDLGYNDALLTNNSDKITAIIDFTALYAGLGRDVKADSLVTILYYAMTPKS